jgi:pimeloyl-ACP methyl ester carboxylesterase
VLPALARARRVITLDVPGFGASEAVGPGFELSSVADRIARGLADCGVSAPFDLVGHSLGAGIALTLATDRPDLVRRLILVAPAGFAPVHAIASKVISVGVEPALSVRRRLVALTDLGWGRRLLLGLTAADPAAIAPTQARMIVGASAEAQRTADAFATITGSDLRPLLRVLSAPLGVIWGDRDRTVPVRHAEGIRRARPDADVVVIEGAGHVAMVERPEAFVAGLEGLLERLPKHATTSSGGTSTVP